jgi:hypothetical protein
LRFAAGRRGFRIRAGARSNLRDLLETLLDRFEVGELARVLEHLAVADFAWLSIAYAERLLTPLKPSNSPYIES